MFAVPNGDVTLSPDKALLSDGDAEMKKKNEIETPVFKTSNDIRSDYLSCTWHDETCVFVLFPVGSFLRGVPGEAR